METTATTVRNREIRNPSLAAANSEKGRAYLDRIRKMSPYERLLYWITERHKVHCKRFPKGYRQVEGTSPTETPPPWTEDPILQTVFFCNPYRENDKVTAYLRDNFREEYKDEECVFLGSILLRWFNYIPTMRLLIKEGIPQTLGGKEKQKLKAIDDAEKLLTEVRANSGQLFSGAYIIKLANGIGKMECIMQVMRNLSERPKLYTDICQTSMSTTHDLLRETPYMGNFYIYQFIGDLAYTHVLEKAPDWWTWSFCGPGTSRGLQRLAGNATRPDGSPWERRIQIPKSWEDQAQQALEKVNKDLAGGNKNYPPHFKRPKMHMRDFTNCLCEYDKYCRALNNERDIKRGYEGRG